MNLCVFEDSHFKNLLPLVYFRPVWELRCGKRLLIEDTRRHFPEDKLFFKARDYLVQYYLPSGATVDGDRSRDLLFINGRLVMREEIAAELRKLEANRVLIAGEEIVAFRLNQGKSEVYFTGGLLQPEKILSDLENIESEAELIRYPWDLIERNGSAIASDFSTSVPGGTIEGTLDDGAHLLGKPDIYVAAGARIMPGAVLNAEEGPIWIDRDVTVMPNAVLDGPLYIGPGSVIKTGAKIYENTSIGPVCKVGGEVEETIIQGFSNKQHDGFLGHSYLGSWINIGADTNNSDLKNNYGEIPVFLNGYSTPTGKQFLGLIMGDHSKTAINTMFNTGTIVGVNCNVYGANFPPKFIPSFSWGGSTGLREYRFEKAAEVAKIVMNRRNREFSATHLKLFEAVKNLAWQVENRARIK